jgi:Zn-dependent metalloprotease
MSLTPKVLSFAVLAALSGAAAAAPNPMAEQAQALIKTHGAAVRAAAADQFVVRDTIRDDDGTEHVRFDRTYRGLPVIGGDVVVHSRGGQFKSASLTLPTSARPALTPRVPADKAMVEAGAVFGGPIDAVSNAGLVVYARGAKPVLAYEIHVQGVSPTQGEALMRYFVDATTGKVLAGWNTIHTATATGTGKTLLIGNVPLTTNSLSASSFQLVDNTRGGGNTRDGLGKEISRVYSSAAIMTDADNIWGNNAESSVQSEASDAHYGVAATWDFYKSVFNRSGIYNDGVGVKSIVNVTFRGAGPATGGNAAWYGAPNKFMAYGSGDSSWLPVVAIDVAGHEMTHGVTEATSNLDYAGDAGGLNEASSDIMGTMVEWFVNQAADAPDYMIGEEIWRTQNATGTKALRYMFRPGDADANRSYNCYPAAGFASVDPHYSSGPANHFFYLLAQGAVNPGPGFNYTASQLVCNGNTAIAGIGRDAAMRIWYRALTVYFNSTESYAKARADTLKAAADLYGTGSANYNAVAAAWSAVSVN